MATKTLDKKTETPANRSDHRLVQIGSVFSRHSHGVVTAIDRRKGIITLRNSQGKSWDVGFNILEWEFSFADQFDNEEKLSRTKVIEILKTNAGTAMTIVYTKKPDAKQAAKDLAAGQGTLTAKEWLKKVTAAQTGAERTMVGHHNLKFDDHQRLYFTEQVNAKSGNPESRLVDLRTLKSMVVNRVKYTVK